MKKIDTEEIIEQLKLLLNQENIPTMILIVTAAGILFEIWMYAADINALLGLLWLLPIAGLAAKKQGNPEET